MQAQRLVDRMHDRVRDNPQPRPDPLDGHGADLLLLEDGVADADLPAVRVACEEVFSLRGRHEWPPAIHIYPLWAEQYRVLALGMDLPVRDVTEAAAAVSAFVSRIASTPLPA